MRVLQVCGSNKAGGAELMFQRTVLGLDGHQGLDVQAVVRRGADVGALRPVYKLRFGGAWDVLTPRQLRRIITTFQPAVVMSWMSRAATHVGKIPVPHVARLGGYYALKYYKHCDHLVVNAPDIGACLTGEGWPSSRLSLISNFVLERPGHAVPRAHYDTPEGAPLIFAGGRHHPNKGFDVLLDALRLLDDTWLWLAGDGPGHHALRARSEAHGLAHRVRFLGWLDEAMMANCYASADVLAVPSRHEPLGNVVLEGWYHRLPVVATQSQGPADLITCAHNGLLVPPDDPAALAEGLRSVLDNPPLAETLREHGARRYAHNHAQAKIMAQYHSLLRTLVEGSAQA